MKISGLGPLQGVGSATNVAKSSNTAASSSLGGSATVSMSKDASWIESLRAALSRGAFHSHRGRLGDSSATECGYLWKARSTWTPWSIH